jgi:biotin transport system substrate-specific component
VASPDDPRWLAHVAIFTGIIAVLGLVPALPIPGMPVPITLQTLGVMLAGAVLGARKGGASVLLFLALVAIGLPLLAGGRGGLGVFAGPSVGFLIGWPIAALPPTACRGGSPSTSSVASWWCTPSDWWA